jgi:putative endonuclease
MAATISRLMRRSSGTYFVYILSSSSGTLYVGITNNVLRRGAEHSIGQPNSFTTRYKLNRLVYFETYTDVTKAIAREKQIKSYRREKKIALIRSINPSWVDLRRKLMRESLL